MRMIKFFITAFLLGKLVIPVTAEQIDLKLPFLYGTEFSVTQGYGINTHVKRDFYALDFAKNTPEDTYGKEVLAAGDGRIFSVNTTDIFGGGYGYFVRIKFENTNLIAIYAHLSEVESLKKGDRVYKGQLLGRIGNSGYIDPKPTAENPLNGSHLHFAIFNSDTLTAYKPEPMSGYTDFAAGNRYLSDNTLYEPKIYAVTKSILGNIFGSNPETTNVASTNSSPEPSNQLISSPALEPDSIFNESRPTPSPKLIALATPSPSPKISLAPKPTPIPTPSPLPSPSPSPTLAPPSLLISEVQITGNSSDDEFVELFNPNNFSVDLTGWSIKRKTSSGNEYSLVSATRLSGKSIPALGYFLAANETGYQGSAIADVGWASSNNISSNNTVLLYAPGKDAPTDKVGFGTAADYENSPAASPDKSGQTLSRISQYDTDKNAIDFMLSRPTPRNSQQTAGAFVSPLRWVEVQTPVSSGSAEPSPSPTPSSSPTPTPVTSKILINEIQVAGSTANDEFIELFNPNETAVDLAGWALKKKTASGNESNLVSSQAFSGTIPAKGFFLIAPQAGYDAATPPDLRYSGATYSIAADNTVLLYDNLGRLIDKVGFGNASDFETATTTNPDANQSIERIRVANQPQDTDNNSADFAVNITPTPTNSLAQPLAALNIQRSHNDFFDNVAWYFDENDQLVIEFDWLQAHKPRDLAGNLLSIQHNFSLAFDGENYLNLFERVGNLTGYARVDPSVFIKNAVGNAAAINFSGIAGENFTLPMHVKTHIYGLFGPIQLSDSDIRWGLPFNYTGNTPITKADFEMALGRPLGKNDFITLAYTTVGEFRQDEFIYGQEVPDNTHFFSNLTNDSPIIPSPTIPPITTIQNVRWGKDDSVPSGVSLEFDFNTWPLVAASDSWEAYGEHGMTFYFDQEKPRPYTVALQEADPFFGSFPGSPAGILINYMTCYGEQATSSLVAFFDDVFSDHSYYDGDGACENLHRAPMMQWLIPQFKNPTSTGPWHLKFEVTGLSNGRPLSSLTSDDYIKIGLWRWVNGFFGHWKLKLFGEDKYYFDAVTSSAPLPLSEPSPSPEPSPNPTPSPTPDVSNADLAAGLVLHDGSSGNGPAASSMSVLFDDDMSGATDKWEDRNGATHTFSDGAMIVVDDSPDISERVRHTGSFAAAQWTIRTRFRYTAMDFGSDSWLGNLAIFDLDYPCPDQSSGMFTGLRIATDSHLWVFDGADTSACDGTAWDTIRDTGYTIDVGTWYDVVISGTTNGTYTITINGTALGTYHTSVGLDSIDQMQFGHLASSPTNTWTLEVDSFSLEGTPIP